MLYLNIEYTIYTHKKSLTAYAIKDFLFHIKELFSLTSLPCSLPDPGKSQSV